MFDLVLALLAGIVAVAAPCMLVMLPVLLGASGGQTSNVRAADQPISARDFSQIPMVRGRCMLISKKGPREPHAPSVF